MILEEPLT